jgi:hypothetical protein
MLSLQLLWSTVNNDQASKAIAAAGSSSSARADVSNDVSDTSSKPSAQELKAHKLRLDTLTLASEDIAEASAALKKDLEQGILGDLDQVSLLHRLAIASYIYALMQLDMY